MLDYSKLKKKQLWGLKSKVFSKVLVGGVKSTPLRSLGVYLLKEDVKLTPVTTKGV